MMNIISICEWSLKLEIGALPRVITLPKLELNNNRYYEKMGI